MTNRHGTFQDTSPIPWTLPADVNVHKAICNYRKKKKKKFVLVLTCFDSSTHPPICIYCNSFDFQSVTLCVISTEFRSFRIRTTSSSHFSVIGEHFYRHMWTCTCKKITNHQLFSCSHPQLPTPLSQKRVHFIFDNYDPFRDIVSKAYFIHHCLQWDKFGTIGPRTIPSLGCKTTGTILFTRSICSIQPRPCILAKHLRKEFKKWGSLMLTSLQIQFPILSHNFWWW